MAHTQTTRRRACQPPRWMSIFAPTTILLVASWRPVVVAQRASPHETATYQVGRATIELTYGRPSRRGRAIFGALVPFEKVWMPGADEATILETNASLQFGGVRVPAGSYSLYTIPSPNVWKLIVNKQTGQWGTVYDEKQDLARIDMKKQSLPSPAENFTIAFDQVAPDTCRMRLEWETTRGSLDFKEEK